MAIYDLVDNTDSTGARVNPYRFGFSKRKDHVVVVLTLARAFITADGMQTKAGLKRSKKD